MDRDVTVRFYRIDMSDEATRSPCQALREIASLPRRGDGERDVHGDVRLRLESLSEDDDLLFGEFTRVQHDNLPGHVTRDATAPLPVDEIGHYVAYCYDPDTEIMALMFDQKIGVGRICNYLSHFSGGGDYQHLPVLRQGTLDRFERETPTEIKVRIAGIDNFRAIPGDRDDYEDQIEQYAQHFDAMNIEIRVSARAETGGLNAGAALQAIKRFLSRRQAGGGVATLTAKTLESDEAYNFINHLLKEKEKLEFTPNDQVRNSEIRIRYVRACYERHRTYLRATAGV